MPKKKQPESQEQQSARFRAEAERMIAAGELNPTEADIVVDRMIKSNRFKNPARNQQGG